jgi:hypothetical protein
MDRLATLLSAKGDYEEAEPLARCALEIEEAAFGPEHPNTAIAMHNLATLLLNTGSNRYEVRGAHSNSLGLFLHTSTPYTWSILSAS